MKSSKNATIMQFYSLHPIQKILFFFSFFVSSQMETTDEDSLIFLLIKTFSYKLSISNFVF